MSSVFPDVCDLVPHGAPMSLLDRVVSSGPDEVECEAVIRKDHVFYTDSVGVPAWIGLEYMAQAAAVYGGLNRSDDNAAPPVGFLLGCRNLLTTLPGFKDGMCIRIQARFLDESGGLHMFRGEIFDGATGESIMEATFNIFIPKNPDAYLGEQS